MNERFVESAATFAAYIVFADGKIDQAELTALKTLSRNQGFEWDFFKSKVKEVLVELIDESDSEDINIDPLEVLKQASYTINPENVEQLILDLIDVVLSDGKLDMKEVDILVNCRIALHIDEVYFTAVLVRKIIGLSGQGRLQATFDELLNTSVGR